MQLSGSELHQINLSLCPFCHIYSLHDPRELHYVLLYTNISHKYTGGFRVSGAMNSQVFSTTTTTILVTTTTITSYYYYYY